MGGGGGGGRFDEDVTLPFLEEFCTFSLLARSACYKVK